MLKESSIIIKDNKNYFIARNFKFTEYTVKLLEEKFNFTKDSVTELEEELNKLSKDKPILFIPSSSEDYNKMTAFGLKEGVNLEVWNGPFTPSKYLERKPDKDFKVENNKNA